MKSLSANLLPDTFVSQGSVLVDLCESIEGRSTAIPIIRARATLDAREIVAAGRAESAMAPDLAGTVVPIVVQEPQDALAGLFAVALAGGVPLVLSGSRTYESATSVQRRVNDVAEKVNARFVYLHGTWQQVSKHSQPDVAHEQTAFLQFSSGSVGSPRPLRISHRALSAQLEILADATAVGSDPVAGSWLPLSHDMGLVSTLLGLSLGCPLLLWSPEEFLTAPAQWIEQMATHRVGFWPVIPAGMHIATKALASRGRRLDALRAVLVGADVIRPNVLTAFESTAGCGENVVRPCYGLADATLMVTCAPGDRHWRTVDAPETPDRSERFTRLVSVGPPARNTEVWIEVGGRPAGERIVGDVVVRSASRCSGPFGGEVIPASVPVHTGDLGFIADGELVFTGRAAEVVRVAGQDFLPTEVEDFLVRTGFGKTGRVAVVGVDHDAATQMVAVIESGSDVSDDAAMACRRELLGAARAAGLPLTGVRFVPRNWLSKTTSGKLRRRRIAADLMEAGNDRLYQRITQ
ncbi:AMP-binding protein [Mycobacterium sp. SP-6446]|uniref:AMP-binding protein n=1 Tax=Mycobacterium sp. SP-6446 TaxID=1834162 RepID=UPI00158B42F4|nr:AMP-binding protein [Mycobacterium sp. SP-6446]